MDASPPASWSYAARAGYFGDRVCPFCDRHNPAAAKFCNDCGSPLHMKPCNQCDAVNDQAATNCYVCGAECPASFTTPEATPLLPTADPTLPWATPDDVDVAATEIQPSFAAGALGANWRLAAIATMLIAGVYAAYRINASTPDAIGVASQPIDAGEHNAPTAASAVLVAGERRAPTAASAVLVAVESKPVEPEATAARQTPIPTTDAQAPKRASARQRPVAKPQAPVAATRPVGATRPVAQTVAAAPVSAPVTETRKTGGPDPWQAMHVSLARCDGDLIARIVCDQRVRRRFCEGHWGEAPECASSVVNDRGQ